VATIQLSVIVQTNLFIRPLLPQLFHLCAEFCHNFLQILHRGQFVPDRSGQLPGHTIGRDADRFGDIAEGIFGQGAVVGLTEKQPYGWGIRSIAEQIVDGRQIEVELARPLGLEL
jgi:hypothetical protein